jgi:peroxin-6
LSKCTATGVDNDIRLAASLNRPYDPKDDTIFVAISLQTPLGAVIEDSPWTIFSIRMQDSSHLQNHETVRTTIRFPRTSSCGRSFIDYPHLRDPSQHGLSFSSAIEVQLVSVKPLVLDTVYVTVEKDLLEEVDNAQKRFGGGFNDSQKNNTNERRLAKAGKVGDASRAYWNTSGSVDSRLARVVRDAVAVPPIIHAGDTLTLPLPSHPITHIAPPPAYVSACEPVSQGLISSTTRIVLVQTESVSDKTTRSKSTKAATHVVIEDDADDTSNEQFYSAAEDREDGFGSDAEDSSEQSDADDSSQLDSDDISDDSLEDMISLQAPSLPLQRLGVSSGTSNVTPRLGGQKYTGSHTPGSLFSNFTAATARGGNRPGKVCRAEALLRKFANAALHPTPSDYDDEQSFVFVDINTLTKIGCFAGDWVRLEKCKRPHINGIPSLNFDRIELPIEDSSDWRPVRIFGLSNLAPRKSRFVLGRKATSSSGVSSSSLIPAVYIAPVLLHNLGAPSFVRLTALPKPDSSTSPPPAKPPLAKEVTLRKVSTPMSTKKEVQSSLFANLKKQFQNSSRILKAGDLIAVPVDEGLGKAIFETSQSVENRGEDVVVAGLVPAPSGRGSRPSIAWFVVDQVVQEDTNRPNSPLDDEGQWGGIAMVDSLRTRMAQAGNCVQGIPESLARGAAIWLSSRKSPPSLSPLAVGLFSDRLNMQPYVLPLQKRLSDLVSSATSLRAVSLGMPPLAILLHSTQRQIGKSYIASSACAAAGAHVFTISAHDILADGGSSNAGGDAKTDVSLKIRAERAFSCGSQFTAILITHVEMLTADRMIPTLSEVISDSRVLIATTTELDKIPDGIRSLFTHELEVTAPDERDREGILRNACLQQALRLDGSVQLEAVALKTAALVAGDLIDVVHRASLARARRVENMAVARGVSTGDIQMSGGPIVSNVTATDFNEAIASARSTFSDSIGAPKIPTVTWKDVGGLADQKSSIMETISLPLTRPELFAKGMRKRSGILFYGPPGTGKTLLAKAIATELSLNFFSVKGPELLNMYIGESEANVRRVFQRARDARPCVVFFDELDSVAPKRGNQGDSGGVMDRIVSQLLAELDGMSSGGSSDKDSGGANGNAGGVFVIGATNRPDLLDPALLRPGRFDKMLYLGVSSTHEQQATILQALTRKFTLARNVDLTRVASALPFTYTGADLYALCSDAMLKAITKKTKQVDIKVQEASRARGEEISTAYYFDHLATPDDITVVVGEDDFAAAQKELVASVR